MSRNGQKVPEAEGLGLNNVGVDLDATVLYADLAESTALVKQYSAFFAAEVYKTYLYTAARVIRKNGGVITAYDGDRVMAIYIGDNKNTSAAKTALQINWVVTKILNPKIAAQYPNMNYKLQQKVGIDTSAIMAARTGIRGSNDIVWVGTAANNAAKLAARDSGYATYISGDTYSKLHRSAKYGGDDDSHMWADLGVGTEGIRVYGSTWHWSI